MRLRKKWKWSKERKEKGKWSKERKEKGKWSKKRKEKGTWSKERKENEVKEERRKVDIEKRQVYYIQIYIERGNGTLRQRTRKEEINRGKRERKR